MLVKRFTTYEFDICANKKTYNVLYKKNEDDSNKSTIEISADDELYSLSSEMLLSLYEAMKEVDPIDFVFRNDIFDELDSVDECQAEDDVNEEKQTRTLIERKVKF
jgi:hypothetical protein